MSEGANALQEKPVVTGAEPAGNAPDRGADYGVNGAAAVKPHRRPLHLKVVHVPTEAEEKARRELDKSDADRLSKVTAELRGGAANDGVEKGLDVKRGGELRETAEGVDRNEGGLNKPVDITNPVEREESINNFFDEKDKVREQASAGNLNDFREDKAGLSFDSDEENLAGIRQEVEEFDGERRVSEESLTNSLDNSGEGVSKESLADIVQAVESVKVDEENQVRAESLHNSLDENVLQAFDNSGEGLDKASVDDNPVSADSVKDSTSVRALRLIRKLPGGKQALMSLASVLAMAAVDQGTAEAYDFGKALDRVITRGVKDTVRAVTGGIQRGIEDRQNRDATMSEEQRAALRTGVRLRREWQREVDAWGLRYKEAVVRCGGKLPAKDKELLMLEKSNIDANYTILLEAHAEESGLTIEDINAAYEIDKAENRAQVGKDIAGAAGRTVGGVVDAGGREISSRRGNLRSDDGGKGRREVTRNGGVRSGSSSIADRVRALKSKMPKPRW